MYHSSNSGNGPGQYTSSGSNGNYSSSGSTYPSPRNGQQVVYTGQTSSPSQQQIVHSSQTRYGFFSNSYPNQYHHHHHHDPYYDDRTSCCTII